MKTKWIGMVSMVAVSALVFGCSGFNQVRNGAADACYGIGNMAGDTVRYEPRYQDSWSVAHGRAGFQPAPVMMQQGPAYQQQYCAPQQPATVIWPPDQPGVAWSRTSWAQYQQPIQQQQQVVVQPAPQVIYQQAPPPPAQKAVVAPTPSQVVEQPMLGTNDCGWVQVVNMSGYNAHIVWTGGSKDLKGQESVFLPFAKGRTVNLKAVMNYNGDNVDIASGTFVIGDIISAWTLRDPGDNGPIPTDPAQAP